MRYFIVFFKSRKDYTNYEGHMDMSCDGGYISKSQIARDFKESGHDWVKIVNIIELTERDYKDWKA
jgi:hypothetical protein